MSPMESCMPAGAALDTVHKCGHFDLDSICMASSPHPIIYRFSFTMPTRQTGLTTSLHTDRANGMPILSGDCTRAAISLHKPLVHAGRSPSAVCAPQVQQIQLSQPTNQLRYAGLDAVLHGGPFIWRQYCLAVV